MIEFSQCVDAITSDKAYTSHVEQLLANLVSEYQNSSQTGGDIAIAKIVGFAVKFLLHVMSDAASKTGQVVFTTNPHEYKEASNVFTLVADKTLICRELASFIRNSRDAYMTYDTTIKQFVVRENKQQEFQTFLAGHRDNRVKHIIKSYMLKQDICKSPESFWTGFLSLFGVNEPDKYKSLAQPANAKQALVYFQGNPLTDLTEPLLMQRDGHTVLNIGGRKYKRYKQRTLTELRQLAKSKGIKGSSSLNKSDLIRVLRSKS